MQTLYIFIFSYTFSACNAMRDNANSILTAVMVILQFATSSLLLFCVRYSVDTSSFCCLFVSHRLFDSSLFSLL